MRSAESWRLLKREPIGTESVVTDVQQEMPCRGLVRHQHAPCFQERDLIVDRQGGLVVLHRDSPWAAPKTSNPPGGWRGGRGRLLLVHANSAFIYCTAVAVGNADGGPLNWGFSGIYVLSQVLWTAADFSLAGTGRPVLD